LRIGAVALREERQSLTIDGPEAIADLNRRVIELVLTRQVAALKSCGVN